MTGYSHKYTHREGLLTDWERKGHTEEDVCAKEAISREGGR